MNKAWKQGAAVAAVAMAALAAGPGTAQAAVTLMLGSLHATAQVFQVDPEGASQGVPGGFSHPNCSPTGGFCDLGWSGAVRRQSTSTLRAGSARAFQDSGGWFEQEQSLELRNFGAGLRQVSGITTTDHEVSVATDRPDTPLLLDVFWVGGTMSAGTYYGLGDLLLTMGVTISASRDGFNPEPVWSFVDEIASAPGSTSPLFTSARTELDRLGAGLPTRRFETAWREMMVWGDLERESFVTTLDFGLLQPGERFNLRYEASTTVLMSDVPYASRAFVELKDPFGLRPGGASIALRGLDLAGAGDPPAAVPAPASLGLVLAALGLGAWRRRATMRPRCPRCPGSS